MQIKQYESDYYEVAKITAWLYLRYFVVVRLHTFGAYLSWP